MVVTVFTLREPPKGLLRQEEGLIQLLDLYQVPYVRKRITHITAKDIENLLHHLPEGFDAIIRRTTTYDDQLSFWELANWLANNTQLLKTPLAYDDHHSLAGFKANEARVFVPKGVRQMALKLKIEEEGLNAMTKTHVLAHSDKKGDLLLIDNAGSYTIGFSTDGSTISEPLPIESKELAILAAELED